MAILLCARTSETAVKQLRIIHRTEYHYRQPVGFAPHRVMMRPREGHDIRIVQARFDVEPKASVRWLRDIYNNSIAVLEFAERSPALKILAEVDVEYRGDPAVECLIDPSARLFPFQ